jgi:hypothetical protein
MSFYLFFPIRQRGRISFSLDALVAIAVVGGALLLLAPAAT